MSTENTNPGAAAAAGGPSAELGAVVGLSDFGTPAADAGGQEGDPAGAGDTAAQPAAGAPESYEVKLPESFQLPDGFELPAGQQLIDPSDPRIAAAQEFARGAGMSQSHFENMIELGVKMDIEERVRLNEAVAKERDALGPRAVERINAVTSWLDAKLGADMGKSLHSMLFTRTQVEAMERLMQLNRGDIPGQPGAGREAKPAEVSDEDWDKMSPTQKINYARERSAAGRRR